MIRSKIDLILRKSRSFSQGEFRHQPQVSIDTLYVLVAAAEDVIISKLEWAKLSPSAKADGDMAGILQIQRLAFDRSYWRDRSESWDSSNIRPRRGGWRESLIDRTGTEFLLLAPRYFSLSRVRSRESQVCSARILLPHLTTRF
jgi:hypothetical protein